MRFRYDLLLGVAIVAALGAVLFPLTVSDPWASTRGIPGERDPRFLGRWWDAVSFTGSPQRGEDRRIAEVRFEADGTGKSLSTEGGEQPFRWGTRDGVLYARYLTVDYWPLVTYPYDFSENESVLQLRGVKEQHRAFRRTLKRY